MELPQLSTLSFECTLFLPFGPFAGRRKSRGGGKIQTFGCFCFPYHVYIQKSLLFLSIHSNHQNHLAKSVFADREHFASSPPMSLGHSYFITDFDIWFLL